MEVVAEAGQAEYDDGFEVAQGGRDSAWVTIRVTSAPPTVFSWATGTDQFGPFTTAGEYDQMTQRRVERPAGSTVWFYHSNYNPLIAPTHAPFYTTDFVTWTEIDISGLPPTSSDIKGFANIQKYGDTYWTAVSYNGTPHSAYIITTTDPAGTWTANELVLGPAADLPGTHTGAGNGLLFNVCYGDGAPTVTYAYDWAESGNAYLDLLTCHTDDPAGIWTAPTLLKRRTADFTVISTVFPAGMDGSVSDVFVATVTPTEAATSDLWRCNAPTLDGTWSEVSTPAAIAASGNNFQRELESGLWYIAGTDASDKPVLYAGEAIAATSNCDIPDISGLKYEPWQIARDGGNWVVGVSSYDAEDNWVRDYYLAPGGTGGWD